MDLQRMESMIAAIQLGVTLDEARARKLVTTPDDARQYRALEAEYKEMRAAGKMPDTPLTMI